SSTPAETGFSFPAGVSFFPGGKTSWGHPTCRVPPRESVVRRRPSLPHSHGCSTIGAGGLSFRVRNVTGRFPSAMAAVTSINHINHHGHTRVWGVGCWFRCRIVDAYEAFLWSSPRPISTSQLNLLPGLHFWPINPLVWVGALPPHGVGYLI